jgi:dTDP-4-dehydrorhamnose reductase
LLVHYSTDYVYDGTKNTPYVEDDVPNPLNVYGKSKLNGERAITSSGCAHLILRASWIYSERGTNFVLTMLRLAQEKAELSVVDDQVGCPSWAKPLAQTSADILARMRPARSASGIYHLSAGGYVTRMDFAKAIVAQAKALYSPDIQWAEIRSTTTAEFPLPAARPLFTASSKDKIEQAIGIQMPGWQEQLHSFIQQLSGH